MVCPAIWGTKDAVSARNENGQGEGWGLGVCFSVLQNPAEPLTRDFVCVWTLFLPVSMHINWPHHTPLFYKQVCLIFNVVLKEWFQCATKEKRMNVMLAAWFAKQKFWLSLHLNLGKFEECMSDTPWMSQPSTFKLRTIPEPIKLQILDTPCSDWKL